MPYPMQCNGRTFTNGAEFDDWVDELYGKERLTTLEYSAIMHAYDNGYLSHPDYKHLIKKPVKR